MDARNLQSVVSLLGEATQLPNLEHSERVRLAQFTHEVKLRRGEVLFHRDNPCSGIHVLISGQIKLAVVSNLGKEKIVELVGPGQLIGADTVLSHSAYTVFAEALTDCHLLHIAKAGIETEFQGISKVGHSLLCALTERFRQLIGEVEAYALHTGKERVVSFMLREVERIGAARDEAVLHLPVQKGVIASLLNLTQEHFSRILHELQAHGLIRVDGRFIAIPSISKMKSQLPGSLIKNPL